ncbi:hypothetical protein [Paratissierella segnis]|uniref:Uncharacterized protein n=1 Tax=Paratissierella segnis TaxID=2763679 RepID=A0A926EQT5_9FIRM|nr:hypothetical protein [Paratissierella segnis]MBC8587111.1 hypothetical protein [Paratissierella segnis]
MTARAGNEVDVKISGDAVVATGLSTITSDNQTYQIEDTLKQVIKENTPVTIYDNGVVTSEKYTIDRLNGKIEFETIDATRIITIDCTYLPLMTVAEAHTADFNDEVETLDATTFKCNYRKRIFGLQYAYGTLSHFNILDNLLRNALLKRNMVVLEIKFTEIDEPVRMYAMLEKNELKLAVDSIQDTTVSFISSGKFYH